MIMLVSFLRVYCVIRYVPSFCVSNVAWKYSLPFDRTGVDVAMVLPFDLTVNACLARSVQLFPDSEWILASVNFPFLPSNKRAQQFIFQPIDQPEAKSPRSSSVLRTALNSSGVLSGVIWSLGWKPYKWEKWRC